METAACVLVIKQRQKPARHLLAKVFFIHIRCLFLAPSGALVFTLVYYRSSSSSQIRIYVVLGHDICLWFPPFEINLVIGPMCIWGPIIGSPPVFLSLLNVFETL